MGVDFGIWFTIIEGVLCGLKLPDAALKRIGLNIVS